ncbi:restriction endonuclease [Microcella flavibacter]|uniref:restriction endonuclease n=1 Tax=Microcella flavibacter TaxID=1804990 RepID=UPI001456DFE1|nr:restriction endonuclease [Microcella flavibacter]
MRSNRVRSLAVAEHIAATISLAEPPTRVVDLIAGVMIIEHSFTPDEAAEFAEQRLDGVKRGLESILDVATPSGTFARFAFNSSSDEHLQGSCFVPPEEEGTPIADAKRRRLDFDEYGAFLRGLNWRQFEACCRGILALLGCKDPRLTASANDQGIDFFGRLSLEGRLDISSHLPSPDRRLEVWMVGQAKHYSKTRVSTPDLRELVGSVELARTGAVADDGRALQGFEPRVCDPVFYLFLTTGSISADGLRLLAASGVVGLDTGHIATLLTDAGIGLRDGDFDATAALAWVDSNLNSPS